MKMDSRALVSEIIGHGDLDGISHVGFERRTWELSVDSDHWSRESVWRYLHPTNTPSIRNLFRSWRRDVR